jgi:hypothetical protein
MITLITAVCFGKAYDVASKGNDSNASSLKSPFRTIRKAADVI